MGVLLLRRRIAAIAIALLHVATLTALPLLHARYHALHGEDHVHTDAGTIAVEMREDTDVERHLAFDASLASLGISDVFVAGTVPVDCSLAAYTLVDACGVEKPAGHAIGFGDSLPHHHQHSAADPTHGLHSLAHGGAPLLAVAPVLVVPAPEARVFQPPTAPAFSLVSLAPVRPASRRPPLA